MQSSRPDGDPDGDSDMSIDDVPDTLLNIPDFARAWESLTQVTPPVRRPSSPPDPQSYHRDIDPQVIFQLDELQKDGSQQTITVVPSSCTRCRTLRQACSRSKPACTRCKKSGQDCKPLHEGYEKLPGPKISKGSNPKAKSTDATTTNASASGPNVARTRFPRGVAVKTESSLAEPSVATGSKRPFSPEWVPVQSRKKVHAKAVSRKGKERYHTEEPSNIASESDALTWTFVYPFPELDGSETQPDAVSTFISIPRVWTSSLSGLYNAFPDLENAYTGLSWLQSETPLLLLDDNSAEDRWTSSTGLCFNMFWNFSCHDSDLQTTVEPETTPQHISHQLHHEDDHAVDVNLASTSLPSESTTYEVTGSNGMQPVSVAGPSVLQTVDMASSMSDGEELPLNLLPESTTSRVDTHPSIPLVKPAEIETLMDSCLRHIPLLLWMSRNCILAPRTPSTEYAYLCMGFFFISDLRHTVTNYTVCPNSSIVQGQVRWAITLEWAPGGEEVLFENDVGISSDDQPDSDTRKDLSRPWWINPAEASSSEGNASPYRPRDLRMQFATFLPLDLLAGFHPSEFFPRGWFCRACGLVNIQKYFRHQICQSLVCKSTSSELTRQGKVDPLSNLRDLYQSQVLSHPTDNTPSNLLYSEKTSWTDGMLSFTYGIKEKVTLCHVFAGNQESLQTDANTLLETIQREVILCKEDSSSPYFIHTTKFLHTAGGSETTVPVGTPTCVRTAYYILRDFVERYGEMEKPAFGEVHIRAWTTSGSKRCKTFHAKDLPIVILCLGSEVVLKFTPKGGYDDAEPTAPGPREENHEREQPPVSPLMEEPPAPCQPLTENGQSSSDVSAGATEMQVVTETTDQPDLSANVEPVDPVTDQAANNCPDSEMGVTMRDNKMVVASAEPKPKRRQNKGKEKKASTPEISMTLVHGDSAILSGDDFECQIVRTGTSILVIGSS